MRDAGVTQPTSENAARAAAKRAITFGVFMALPWLMVGDFCSPLLTPAPAVWFHCENTPPVGYRRNPHRLRWRGDARVANRPAPRARHRRLARRHRVCGPDRPLDRAAGFRKILRAAHWGELRELRR